MGGRRDPLVTSRIMAAVKGKDTEPERLLRGALFRLGLRYRLHGKGLPGRPDIVFRGARVAVFVDGDFFHGGGWKQRGFASFEEQFSRWRNPSFWMEKIRGNVARDEKATAELRRLGWKVVRIWESDVRKSPERAAARVLRVVNGRRRGR
jgi:DNA mismatch endonuclease, patch repair protein